MDLIRTLTGAVKTGYVTCCSSSIFVLSIIVVRICCTGSNIMKYKNANWCSQDLLCYLLFK
jgi:hypothetical protein